MLRFSRRGIALAGAAAVVTALNFGVQYLRADEDAVGTVSNFKAGSALPALDLPTIAGLTAPAARRALPTGCRFLVLFSVECAHCHSSALREAAVPDSVRMPALWISQERDGRVQAIAASLASTSALRYGGPGVFEKLGVRAVPASFLVSADGTVLAYGGYSGAEEDHRFLRNRCAAA